MALPSNWSVKDYLAKQGQLIEQRLASLPLLADDDTVAKSAMTFALGSRGKRFRPLLVIAAADIYRLGQEPVAIDAGCAIECLHTASLILDDLPCMDDARLRRGRVTTHLKFGEDQAILAAMALIAEADRVLGARMSTRRSAQKMLHQLRDVLHRSYSLAGLCGGQSEDLLDRKDLSLEDLEFIHAKKTGALFIACVEMAAIIGNANAVERQWLIAYAKNLGLAFQVQDDILDVSGSGDIGKDRDQDKSKTSFVDLIGLTESRRLCDSLMQTALAHLEQFREAASHLRALTEVIWNRKN